MTQSRLQTLSLALALLGGLSGCAALPRLSHWVGVKPVEPAVDRSVARQDGYYSSATAAITRRDYARALDLLQSARARKADDVRVLNAFGVVYDKLGRFDLSARYYAQARAVDPNSAIVAGNMAYSVAMQATAARPLLAETLDVAPQRPVHLAQATQPTVVRLGFAHGAEIRLSPGLAGQPLELADASGRANGAEPLREALLRLGWSVSKAQLRAAPVQDRTTITYPERSLTVARALARTLPGQVDMISCAETCEGIRVLVGADATKWLPRLQSAGPARGD
ncbi:LytR C-terminal domain-containing protein [Phenylobacterium sp.]|uniref:LytR C-terminal domain-containing protein n=1 Tax=Phenylobacterium sp. TaxID=1871053 RepID=UPI002733E016|nr:LytR C-terminal domain-containing protein [Phenylobacterium sp.]MDP3852248.1 LytR C-terminal domain-containing protein [Phenylobacterium sp.]